MSLTDASGEPHTVVRSHSAFVEVFLRTWYLGFTSFGGPAVHFQIFRQKFVQGPDPWLDEQTYQELFAICQSLPGPGSTKFHFCNAYLRGGVLAALQALATWSLPGAIGMCVLGVGVSHISTTLPHPVYALLSGLNAAVVGVIAFAGVQLSEKAITDQLSRLIVLFTACAGLCYSALWYFPVLLVITGSVTLFWDMWGRNYVRRLKVEWRRKRLATPEAPVVSTVEDIPMGTLNSNNQRPLKHAFEISEVRASASALAHPANVSMKVVPDAVRRAHGVSIRVGIAIIVAFFVSFIAIMVANAVWKRPPLELRLFRSMYLAGTIIFGGGPVVIPLLRDYVVGPGWVTPRDFLIGLAIIQAFPGPNFNFAVYLGALTLIKSSPVLGAFLGFLGIFSPGILLALGFQTIWGSIRSRPSVVAMIRGINAGAVGLVYTAVYRLWQIGYLTPGQQSGVSLGAEPWWLVTAVVAFASTAWFKVETWVAILAGAVLGLGWYGVVRPWD